MKMFDENIKFDTALLLDKIGFKLDYSEACYDSDKTFYVSENLIKFVEGSRKVKIYQAPTQSLVQKYLREIYSLHVEVSNFLDENDKLNWDFCVIDLKDPYSKHNIPKFLENYADSNREYDTYEEALEAGLLWSIGYIYNKLIANMAKDELKYGNRAWE